MKKTTENKSSGNKEKFIIFAIIGIILAVSLFLFFLNIDNGNNTPTNQTITKQYKGFAFTKENNFWYTQIEVTDRFKRTKKTFDFYVHYTPDEVENIPTMRNSNNESVSPNLLLNVQTVYITTDPEYPAEVVLGGVEIAKVIAQIYGKEVKSATTRPDNRTKAPVITCDDLSASQRIILLNLGNETKIYSDHGCIVVQGTNATEVVKASERLAYEMLKIL